MPEGQWEPRMSAERTAQIRAAVLAEVANGSRANRWRTGAATIAMVGVLAVGGAVWAGIPNTQPQPGVVAVGPDQPATGYCSAEATLDPDVWKHHEISASGGVQACAELWRSGDVGVVQLSQAPLQYASGDIVAPDLVACDVDGFLVVYPGDGDTCQQLGVPAFDATH